MLREKNEVLFGTKTMLQLMEEGNQFKKEEELKAKTITEEKKAGAEEDYWRVKWMIRLYRQLLQGNRDAELYKYCEKRIRIIQEECNYTELLARRNQQRQLGGN